MVNDEFFDDQKFIDNIPKGHDLYLLLRVEGKYGVFNDHRNSEEFEYELTHEQIEDYNQSDVEDQIGRMYPLPIIPYKNK
ncbi:hypothetical protein NGC89_02435 [Staphylococcus xylosus]|uniref:hypothetical protein n=1 Tax=Staphylococcus xylosus TaxID=1288 RepID=UPI002DB739CA|nr:hypothetical protein [Staphylococcus xylosus]MEB7800324.1 hypothetical protein [Staphylococcus xylosus]